MLQARCKRLLCTSNLPRHVSAANCHLQGVTRSSQATPVLSVPQLDVGYGSLSMTSCCGISTANYYLQGVTRSSQATPVLSVPQLDIGYGSLSMASCREISTANYHLQ